LQELTLIRIEDLTPQQIRAAVAVGIAVGTLYCFLGYRAFKFIIALTGFSIGGLFAGGCAGWAASGQLTPIAILGLIGGVLGAVVVFMFYRIGVFILGLAGGAIIARAALGGASDIASSSITLGAAVFGALSGLFLERPLMTIATSAIGAWLTVHGIAFFTIGAGSVNEFSKALASPDTTLLLTISWAGLTCLGAFAQFVTHKPKGQP
jgi:hypothetical protein